MKYDFVCKSDPVSHINNRKTTTQDNSECNIKGTHLSLIQLFLPTKRLD